MSKKVQKPKAGARVESAAAKAAVVGALSLLSASMGLVLGDAAQAGQVSQDVTVNKAKTADKAFKSMDDYIRASKIKQPSNKGANAGAHSSGGGGHRK